MKGQIELAGYPKDEVPSVWMDIKPDMKEGYNIHFITTNFKFAPENVSTMHVMGQGTINLYVNGERIARVYDEWYHVNLEPGVYEIMATLNSNELTEYTIRGKPISSSESITVD